MIVKQAPTFIIGSKQQESAYITLLNLPDLLKAGDVINKYVVSYTSRVAERYKAYAQSIVNEAFANAALEMRDIIANNFDAAHNEFKGNEIGRKSRAEEFRSPGEILRSHREIEVEELGNDFHYIVVDSRWLDIPEQLKRKDIVLMVGVEKPRKFVIRGRKIFAGVYPTTYHYWRLLEYGTVVPSNYIMAKLTVHGKEYYYMRPTPKDFFVKRGPLGIVEKNPKYRTSKRKLMKAGQERHSYVSYYMVQRRSKKTFKAYYTTYKGTVETLDLPKASKAYCCIRRVVGNENIVHRIVRRNLLQIKRG